MSKKNPTRKTTNSQTVGQTVDISNTIVSATKLDVLRYFEWVRNRVCECYQPRKKIKCKASGSKAGRNLEKSFYSHFKQKQHCFYGIYNYKSEMKR